MWEAGEGTFRELSGLFGVAVSSIKHRSQRENWQRGARESEIADKIREDTISQLARLGMPKERFLRLIIEGAVATRKLANVKRRWEPPKKKPAKGSPEVPQDASDALPLIVEQSEDVIDNPATIKHREMLLDLTGWAAAPKKALGPEEEPDAPEIPYFADITPKPMPI
jgi:hypothetical protein